MLRSLAPLPPAFARPYLLVGAFATLAFGVAFAVSALVSSAIRPPASPVRPASVVVPGSVSPTDVGIGRLQERLRLIPDEPRSERSLAFAYLQKVRETADYSYFRRADILLRKAYEQLPDEVDSLIGLGSLSLSLHQWQDALAWGERAVAMAPSKLDAYGVLGDAQVELGRYEQAAATFQRMLDLRPSATGYARASYLRELNGDLPGAIVAMREAASIAAPLGEAGVWTRVQLGNLLLQTGEIDAAEAEYRAALAGAPNFLLALGGLGRAKMARGDYPGAIDDFTRAFQGLPLPEFVVALGDLYDATGQPDEARRQFELAQALQKLYVASGGNADLELALLEAERGDPAAAVATARGDVALRESVHSYDVLSWALYKAGDYAAARDASRKALRLGTQDGLMLYHAGMIDLAVGDIAAAREKLTLALQRQPGGYSPRLYAPLAQQALERLPAP